MSYTINVTRDSKAQEHTDGKISGITVTKLGEIVNSNVQSLYLKSFTKLGILHLYNKRKNELLKKK